MRWRASLRECLRIWYQSKVTRRGNGDERVPLPVTEKAQMEVFGKAMSHFGAGDFRKARSLFEEASSGPSAGVGESARMYARICEQRLNSGHVSVKTAEDHYNYGISLLNQRKLDDAIKHLKAAISQGEDSGDAYYALGLASGLSGDVHSARQHLERAFQLNPKTRALARTDSDFQSLMEHAELRRLIDEGSGG